MKLKERIAAWVIFGRIAKALGLSRAELKEKLTMPGPLPKFVGYASSIIAFGGMAWTYFHPGQPIPAFLGFLTTLLAQFSHSATGTGGK